MRDTIDMAREAGIEVIYEHKDGEVEWGCSTKQLRTFAALVRADERDKWMERAHTMILGEREACAVIAETPIYGEQDDITMQAKDRVAAAIRARGNT